MIFFEKSMSMSVQSILVAHHSGRIIVVSLEQQVFPVTVYEFSGPPGTSYPRRLLSLLPGAFTVFLKLNTQYHGLTQCSHQFSNSNSVKMV